MTQKKEKSRLKLDFVAAVEMMILISRSSDRIITRIVIVLKEAIYEEQCVPWLPSLLILFLGILKND